MQDKKELKEIKSQAISLIDKKIDSLMASCRIDDIIPMKNLVNLRGEFSVITFVGENVSIVRKKMKPLVERLKTIIPSCNLDDIEADGVVEPKYTSWEHKAIDTYVKLNKLYLPDAVGNEWSLRHAISQSEDQLSLIQRMLNDRYGSKKALHIYCKENFYDNVEKLLDAAPDIKSFIDSYNADIKLTINTLLEDAQKREEELTKLKKEYEGSVSELSPSGGAGIRKTPIKLKIKSLQNKLKAELESLKGDLKNKVFDDYDKEELEFNAKEELRFLKDIVKIPMEDEDDYTFVEWLYNDGYYRTQDEMTAQFNEYLGDIQRQRANQIRETSAYKAACHPILFGAIVLAALAYVFGFLIVFPVALTAILVGGTLLFTKCYMVMMDGIFGIEQPDGESPGLSYKAIAGATVASVAMAYMMNKSSKKSEKNYDNI